MSSVLFVNGKVRRTRGSFAESFGIKNGVFNWIGSNSESSSLKNDYSEIFDLRSKLVLPAFTDGHLHLVKGALMLKLLDCTNINTINELKESIYNFNRINISWIIGGNLNIQKVFGNLSDAEGNILDNIFNEKPLYISNYDYHSAIINTNAFEISNLKNNVNNFDSSEIEFNHEGIFTGLIRENAMNFVQKSIPYPSLTEKAKAVKDCINLLHSKGITAVSDITLPEDLEVYKELYSKGELNIRINSYLPMIEFENLNYYLTLTNDINSSIFRIKGFKAYWDGALGSETALFSVNYKSKTYNGYTTDIVKSRKIFELAKKIDDAGMQIVIHAIGDKAISEVLDLYEELPNTKKLRHRIEHAQHINPADYDRFANLGAIASVQPVHLKYDAEVINEKIPEEISKYTHNYYEILKRGGIINFGTDFPIVNFDPFENIYLASTRKTSIGEYLPELKIPLEECINGYTLYNAYSNHNENITGEISEGKIADFIILEDDIFNIPPEEIKNTAVYKTYFNGKEVYSLV
jgi:predicted amidohydrolase YtcJ